ncbi:MAG: hypothetical protein QM809_06440 [Gordonia sp. (in: high G+C Gram-positive bacteria)]|uniref:hypothetical protein n=1 Tax=Gordonia sp. (in: high G+C Gram-positive bacteria) TaxID=84139 RepID=UPI0039E65257
MLFGLVACGDDDPAPRALSSLVLGAEYLPEGFAVAPADVTSLIGGNRRTLEQAASVTFAPAECRPTADEAFSPLMTSDNTALLVAEAASATLSEVVSSVRRDIDADRRATTGRCRVVEARPTRGTLAGARIVTTSSELPSPSSEAVEQGLVVRSESVTTLTDGKVRVRSALLANLLLRRPHGEVVTVQITVASANTNTSSAAPKRIEPPMSEADFLRLVDDAVAHAEN